MQLCTSDLFLHHLGFLNNPQRQIIREMMPDAQELAKGGLPLIAELIGENPPKRKRGLEKELNWALSHWDAWHQGRFSLAMWGTKDYPLYLQNADNSPYLLFYKGQLPSREQQTISMVGTRKPNVLGRRLAKEIARELAERGYPVVSGLAWGIDSMAHMGALEKGTTLAVLGTPIDRIYPALNKSLASRILDRGGAIISEKGPGMRTHRRDFPLRNRIISGFSPWLMMVQAPVKSGAMGSVDWALDQGREVLIPRESLNHPVFDGGDQLKDQGATIWESGQPLPYVVTPDEEAWELAEGGPEYPESYGVA